MINILVDDLFPVSHITDIQGHFSGFRTGGFGSHPDNITAVLPPILYFRMSNNDLTSIACQIRFNTSLGVFMVVFCGKVGLDMILPVKILQNQCVIDRITQNGPEIGIIRRCLNNRRANTSPGAVCCHGTGRHNDIEHHQQCRPE